MKDGGLPGLRLEGYAVNGSVIGPDDNHHPAMAASRLSFGTLKAASAVFQ
jgi:hypothetical protein